MRERLCVLLQPSVFLLQLTSLQLRPNDLADGLVVPVDVLDLRKDRSDVQDGVPWLGPLTPLGLLYLVLGEETLVDEVPCVGHQGHHLEGQVRVFLHWILQSIKRRDSILVGHAWIRLGPRVCPSRGNWHFGRSPERRL